MGGGHHEGYAPPGHHYYKEVWSPAGGWWCDPKHWRRNTAVAAAGFFGACYLLFQYSAKHEERYLVPKMWIPSQMWAEKFPKAAPADE